ncbi:MAG TPA: ABC transporter permease [Acidimicrobiales bacterium]
MVRVAVGRLASAVPLILLITLGTFVLGQLMPGDQARAVAGPDARPEEVAQVRRDLRLDDPAPVRYVRWLTDAVQGDLGVSAATRRPVADELGRRWPVTASLGVAALTLSLAIGIPIGIAQGLRPGSWLDRALLALVSVGLAAPAFWLATLLVYLLAVERRWLPALGYVGFSESPVEWARHIFMPALTLAVVGGAEIARQLRASLVDVLRQDHIRAATARGLHPRVVIGKHALRNASLPVLTIVGLRIGQLLAGAVVVEEMFELHGLGSYALDAILNQDFAVVQGVVLVTAAVVVAVNLAVDLLYHWANPKARPA